MLFNKNDKIANERIIYETRPNMILGCKKAILGIILLIVILSVASPVISYIGNMQVYLISYINVGLTYYTAIALFVIIFILILYIIWQLLSWYSISYTLTDRRIIVKKGLLNTKKSYMPYNTIQDINTSQNIIERLLNIGTVSIFSAYDNNQMEIANISSPGEVEEILFDEMNRFRFNDRSSNDFNNQYDEYPPRNLRKSSKKHKKHNHRFNKRKNPPRNLFEEEGYSDDEYRPYMNEEIPDNYYEERQYSGNYYEEPQYDNNYEEEYSSANDYYKEQNHSKGQNNYEYYPEDLNYQNNSHKKYKKYDYEYYDGDNNLERNIDSAMKNLDGSYKFEGYNDNYDDSSSYNEEYNNQEYEDSEPYYNDYDEMDYYLDENRNDFTKKESKNKSFDDRNTIVQRHFDKFKK